MSVGTKVNWVTQVTSSNDTGTTTSTAPLFLMVSAFPKGPDNLRVVDASNFNTLYGNYFDFKKYGQPAIQADRIIKDGARLLVQRICADDATYANLQFMALVEEESATKMKNGKKVYKTKDTGVEVTEDERDPEHLDDGTYTEVTYKVAKITYKAASTQNVTNLSQLKLDPTYKETDKTYYNLFSVADIGKGDAGKRVRISNSSSDSRMLEYAVYAIEDIEDSVSIEKRKFTLNPSVVQGNRPLAMTSISSDQFSFQISEEGYSQFIAKIAEITGLDADYLKSQDLLFGKNYKEKEIDQIKVTEDSVDFSYDYGLKLLNGSEGTDFTFGSANYKAKTKAFFGGEITEDIYNVDVYKIDAVADANYDNATKEKIVELANFRKDFFYFRDMGTEVSSYDDLIDAVGDITYTKFEGTYCQAWDVYDPSTRRPITVTCIYSMIDAIINHLNTGRYLPFAGFTISDIIEGTVNYIPKITPTVDQTEGLEELKINYGTYIDANTFSIQSMFTTTDVNRQLNYIQNVLAVQEVIKDIRTYCPKVRFSFNYAPDFSKYATAIQENVIEQHMTKFASLSFEYTADDDQIEAGIFEASLKFSFNPHVQSEIFNIYAID